MPADPRAENILSFWFGPSSEDDRAISARMSFWFSSNPATDQSIGAQFASVVEQAGSGELDSWRQSPRETLALIILLDQFPRNLGRGTAAAFAHDEQALKLCLDDLGSARQLELGYIEQVFFMMPLQHAESRAVQKNSVRQFEALLERVPQERREHFQGFVKYAHMHNDIVQRFGRFPHRNAILGRTGTPDEKSYLAENAPHFGQN